jgi:hypothetical protein
MIKKMVSWEAAIMKIISSSTSASPKLLIKTKIVLFPCRMSARKLAIKFLKKI